MKEKNEQVITRYAPSPTGFTHVGGVRTALYAYALARKNNGKFILRIEDTDRERMVEGAIEHLVASLRWLGLNWDIGPEVSKEEEYMQSKRLDVYLKYANKLIEKGYAYQDTYTEEEIDKIRDKCKEEKRIFLYRDYRPEPSSSWDGKSPLRFKVPEIKPYKWHDEVRGELSAGPEALDDFILIKSDGYPTYNFAHIIDDYEMGVTHIIRADEFIASTPKFLSLYEALDINPPKFVTLPPILGPDGKKKLSKRDGAKDILDYKKDGYLKSAMINFLAYLGWNPGDEREIMKEDEFINSFDVSHIHKNGAILQVEKLNWINKEHIKLQSDEENKIEIRKFLPEVYSDEMLGKMLPNILERISYYGEIKEIEQDQFRFLIEKPKVDRKILPWKGDTEEKAIENLKNLKGVIDKLDFQNMEEMKEGIMNFASQIGKGNVLWPLRVVLSGKEKSMDPFSICYIIGKDETLRRIEEVTN